MAENRRGQHPPAFKVLAAVHLLPEPSDFARIAAEQKLPVMPHRAHYG